VVALRRLEQIVIKSDLADAPHQLRMAAGRFPEVGSKERVAIKAAYLLLADLLEQGWTFSFDTDLWGTPPAARVRPGESTQTIKERLRKPLLAARAGQLSSPSVRRFVSRMETPRIVGGRRVSVADLIDDGDDLAKQLRAVTKLPDDQQDHALSQLIQPVVQLALTDHRCEYTDLSLIDIWRYFRHTWTLEYRSSPGRTLLILLRNAARPMAPVMGIASLNNSLPQLSRRDHWIGWTAEGFIRRMSEDPSYWPVFRKAMLRTIREGIRHIRDRDLLEKIGPASGAERERRLKALAADAYQERKVGLRARETAIRRGEKVEPLKTEPRDRRGNIKWRVASESPLFIRKRAETLARLFFARRILTAPAAAKPLDPETLARFCNRSDSNDLTKAVRIGLKELQKTGLASRVLDVNVCGAVSPYRDLLVGKLMALAFASAEILDGYRRRYEGQVSEIASKMAGKPTSPSNDLCLLTTTGLYSVGASQYNRLKVKVLQSTGEQETVHWVDIGATKGYGTAHLGQATLTALRELTIATTGERNVNNIFGEGMSPRLRQAREGLEALGLKADDVLQHSATRKVYAMELRPNARTSLLENVPVSAGAPKMSEITIAWQQRWLKRRIMNPEILERVARVGPQTVRDELADPQSPRLSILSTDPKDENTSVKSS